MTNIEAFKLGQEAFARGLPKNVVADNVFCGKLPNVGADSINKVWTPLKQAWYRGWEQEKKLNILGY
jgi:hypothetical protein